jgi:NO-binding membrane sensor protein with MHYT domain
MIITGTYDPYLVALSILVASFASYAALDLGGRVRLAQGPMHRIWLAAAALTMGAGIWSMHFVAMLAFMLPMPVSYDVGLAVLSLILAILATGGGFYVMSRPGASRLRLVLSGLFMGLGILTMHYTGMAALRGPVELSYEPLWVALSVIIAIGVATAALWLAFRATNPGQKLAAAIVMGVAISGMHYTGMRATICTAHATTEDAHKHATLDQTSLALAIAGFTLADLAALFASVSMRKRDEEALRQTRADLAHIHRVTSMGELCASLAHDVNQPITGAIVNANACLHWLAGETPDLEEARAAALRAVNDGRRVSEIIGRVRVLYTKESPQWEPVDVNEIIREMVVLLKTEVAHCAISVRTELAADLSRVRGDRVQLQQVMMNLILNSIEAMKDVDGARELAITSQPTGNTELVVRVKDTGVGLPPGQADQIFAAFFTTKRHGTGMGMGLRISRSIIEAHGGQVWATSNVPRGAVLQFRLPADGQEASSSQLARSSAAAA